MSKISRRNKIFLKRLVIGQLKNFEVWKLDTGEYYTCYWKYYESYMIVHNMIVKFRVDPSFIMINTISVFIDDEKVYEFKAIPFLYIFRLILTMRLFLHDDKITDDISEKNNIINNLRKDGVL